MTPARAENWTGLWSPAKVNLFLELHRRRSDGYHDLETVMVAINVFDHLAAHATADRQIKFHCRWISGMQPMLSRSTLGDLPTGERNIAYRALELLQERAKVSQGICLCLTKRIPSQAGLGGASADAAHALLLANQAWGIDWHRQQLAELAAELGSDVPFFLHAAAAICRGRGEQVERLNFRVRPIPLVIAKPPQGLATPAVFSRAEVPAEPRSCTGLVAALERGDLRLLGRSLFNRLQSAAASLSPWIQHLQSLFDRYPVLGHAMSGSGSSYFAICRSMRHANHLAHLIRSRGLPWSLAVSTLPTSTASSPVCL